MIRAYFAFWKRSFDFTGRTSRSDFWWAIAGNLSAIAIVFVAWYLVRFVCIGDCAESTKVMSTMSALLYLAASFIPNISIQIRRLRDVGQSPYLILTCFIPIVGVACQVALLFMYARPSSRATA
ncbi:DUF805 domain-containing protein [Synechococcus sp. LTW-G]